MDLAMYILVNKDIEITPEKLAGQVGHAVAVFFHECKNEELENNYMSKHQKKILLECPEKKLLELEKEGYITIRDAGFTELVPNTLTCVNIGIFDRDDLDENGHRLMPKFIKRLQLYRTKTVEQQTIELIRKRVSKMVKGSTLYLRNVYPVVIEKALGDFEDGYELSGSDCDYRAKTDKYDIQGVMREGTAKIMLRKE